MNKPDLFSESNSATYCPEDNKIRLYVGRVPRDEYEALRAEGWTSTPKQDCDFVAHWTPDRRDTAISYAGSIDDEDTPPQERAADRAERFAGYQEKRLNEATGHADSYESGPSAHGYQSEAKANRAAARHDRLGDKASDQWSKAEYWSRRTAGVIEHALYRSEPGVRMGRIKELEAELRKLEKGREEYRQHFAGWLKIASMEDADKQTEKAVYWAGSTGYYGGHHYKHPRPCEDMISYLKEGTSLYTLLTHETHPITGAEAATLFLRGRTELPNAETDWTRHLRLRLGYENQMLEAQGGRAGAVDIVPGGWLISGQPGYRRYRGGEEERRIIKVNKSPVTGRVVSVDVRDNHPSTHNHYGNPYPDGTTKVLVHTVNVERAGPDCYRSPTDEELAAFNAEKEAEKKARKATAPATISLINPTDEDAERLQALINERHVAEWKRHHGEPKSYHAPKTAEVRKMTQAEYSAISTGSYAKAETRTVHASGMIADRESNLWSQRAQDYKKMIGAPLCKVRFAGYDPIYVLIISDKPQKPLPASVWEAKQETSTSEAVAA